MIEIRHENMATSNETRDAYDKIFKEGGIKRRTSYFLWLFDIINLEPHKILIDISCGQGQLVDLAQKKGAHAIGFDFSYQGVKRGTELNNQAGWFVSDGENCGLANHCADYVMHIGSLEHYQDAESGIREIARILKLDGTACILLPNTFSLFGNIKHSIRNGDAFDDGQPLQRYNTNFGWKRLIEKNGLRVVRTVKYEVAPPKTWKDFFWILAHPNKILRILISPLVPLNLANSFIYLCKRSEAL